MQGYSAQTELTGAALQARPPTRGLPPHLRRPRCSGAEDVTQVRSPLLDQSALLHGPFSLAEVSDPGDKRFITCPRADALKGGNGSTRNWPLRHRSAAPTRQRPAPARQTAQGRQPRLSAGRSRLEHQRGGCSSAARRCEQRTIADRLSDAATLVKGGPSATPLRVQASDFVLIQRVAHGAIPARMASLRAGLERAKATAQAWPGRHCRALHHLRVACRNQRAEGQKGRSEPMDVHAGGAPGWWGPAAPGAPLLAPGALALAGPLLLDLAL